MNEDRIALLMQADRDAVALALSYHDGSKARAVFAALARSVRAGRPIEDRFAIVEAFQSEKAAADRRAARLAKLVDRVFARLAAGALMLATLGGMTAGCAAPGPPQGASLKAEVALVETSAMLAADRGPDLTARASVEWSWGARREARKDGADGAGKKEEKSSDWH